MINREGGEVCIMRERGDRERGKEEREPFTRPPEPDI